jgi:hypothetical protein
VGSRVSALEPEKLKGMMKRDEYKSRKPANPIFKPATEDLLSGYIDPMKQASIP